MMGSGAWRIARVRLSSDHEPHCMTGPLVAVKAAMNTTISGSSDARMTMPTVLVNSADAHDFTRSGAGARPCVMV